MTELTEKHEAASLLPRLKIACDRLHLRCGDCDGHEPARQLLG